MKIYRRSVAFAILAAASLSSVTACSAASTSASKTGLTIGVSVLGTAFPAVVALDKGMTDEAKKLGVTLVISDAQGNASKQTNDVADLVTQGVDGIIINALDSKTIVSAADAVIAAKIPLGSAFTTLGTATCAYPGSVAHVGFDEMGWATLQGKEALKLLPDGGNVAIVSGQAGLQSTNIRDEQFIKTIAANPKIKVVAKQPGNFNQATSLTAMSNMLQAQPQLDLVYAPDDTMAAGAIQAITAANRPGIKVLGIGGSKAGLKAVQAGTETATVYSSLNQGGRQIIDAMVAHLRGTDKKLGQCVQVPQTLVNKDNIAQFIDKGEY